MNINGNSKENTIKTKNIISDQKLKLRLEMKVKIK